MENKQVEQETIRNGEDKKTAEQSLRLLDLL